MDLEKALAARPDLDKPAGQGSVEDPKVRVTLKQPNRKLQPADIDELVAAYEAGASQRSLSIKYGMYPKTVRRHLLARGVTLRMTHWPKKDRPDFGR